MRVLTCMCGITIYRLYRIKNAYLAQYITQYGHEKKIKNDLLKLILTLIISCLILIINFNNFIIMMAISIILFN